MVISLMPGIVVSAQPTDRVADLVANMSLKDKITQMLMVDFRDWGTKDFTVMNDEVRQIIEELQNLDNTAVALTLFRELRSVTDNYAIPNDVCEAFETTYNALKRADKHLTAA